MCLTPLRECFRLQAPCLRDHLLEERAGELTLLRSPSSPALCWLPMALDLPLAALAAKFLHTSTLGEAPLDQEVTRHQGLTFLRQKLCLLLMWGEVLDFRRHLLHRQLRRAHLHPISVQFGNHPWIGKKVIFQSRLSQWFP